jgi:pimeloyl-ACP methyl ester carboxylesterase
VVADSSCVLQPGPWTHRTITANGSRFHLAEAGGRDAPLVVLLHDFPQFWWAWRNQLPALAEAGYHVIAMDLRGFGASDKSPRNIATPRSCFDVAGVISSLGHSSATVVGHGLGAQVAWSMPAFAPEVTTAIVALAAPHPLTVRHHRLPLGTATWLQWVQAPWFPERSITHGDGVRDFLHAWSHLHEAVDSQAELYTQVMRLPFAAHCAMEHFRWQVRSARRNDGRAFARRLREAPAVPTLTLHGEMDRVFPPELFRFDDEVAPHVTRREIPGAGHFLPEEAPDAVTAAVLEFLAD